MILNIWMLFFTWIINGIFALLSLISFGAISQLQGMVDISRGFAYLYFWNQYFPVDTCLAIIGILIPFLLSIWAFKFVFAIISIFRGGGHSPL